MGTDPEADTLELPPVPRWGRGRPRLAAHRIHPRRIAAGHRELLARTAAWPLAGHSYCVMCGWWTKPACGH